MDSRIPWQPHIAELFVKESSRLGQLYRSNTIALRENTDGVVLGTPGAESKFNRAIEMIDSVVISFKNLANGIGDIAKRIDNNGLIWQINKTKERIEAEKKKFKDKETIVNLRTEQADALKTKEEGNFHSSWMGLWRPLSDEGRTAIFILSITFGILAVVVIGYLGYTYYLARGGGGGAAAAGATVGNIGANINSNLNNIFSGYGGAFFKRRK